MAWIYIEREQFARMCEKIGVSTIVKLGFRDEGHRKKDKYNDYVRGLKEYLKKLDA